MPSRNEEAVMGAVMSIVDQATPVARHSVAVIGGGAYGTALACAELASGATYVRDLKRHPLAPRT